MPLRASGSQSSNPVAPLLGSRSHIAQSLVPSMARSHQSPGSLEFWGEGPHSINPVATLPGSSIHRSQILAHSSTPVATLPGSSSRSASAFDSGDYLDDANFEILLGRSGNKSVEGEQSSTRVQSEPDKAAGMCIVCMDMPASHIIIPCGHKCICAVCEVQVSACPVCRGPRQQCVCVFASGMQAEVPKVDNVQKSNRKREEREQAEKTKKEHKHKKEKSRKKDKQEKKAKKQKKENLDDVPVALLLPGSSSEGNEDAGARIPTELIENPNDGGSEAILGFSRPVASHDNALDVSGHDEAALVAASSALPRDHALGCPTCKQALGEIK